MQLALVSLIADVNSHTAAAPDESVGLPIILGVLAVVLIGGWVLWRLFSGRTRTPIAETLEETPDRERFAREGDNRHAPAEPSQEWVKRR